MIQEPMILLGAIALSTNIVQKSYSISEKGDVCPFYETLNPKNKCCNACNVELLLCAI